MRPEWQFGNPSAEVSARRQQKWAGTGSRAAHAEVAPTKGPKLAPCSGHQLHASLGPDFIELSGAGGGAADACGPHFYLRQPLGEQTRAAQLEPEEGQELSGNCRGE